MLEALVKSGCLYFLFLTLFCSLIITVAFGVIEWVSTGMQDNLLLCINESFSELGKTDNGCFMVLIFGIIAAFIIGLGSAICFPGLVK